MKLDWERVRSERGPDLGILEVRFDWMRHPAGNPVLKRLVLESVDWINIVALTAEGLSIMVDQYRFGIGARTLETPGGMVDPGEDPLTAAKRELLEETGYGGGEWTYLGAVEPNPAIHPHLCHHFLAEGVEKLAEPEPDPAKPSVSSSCPSTASARPWPTVDCATRWHSPPWPGCSRCSRTCTDDRARQGISGEGAERGIVPPTLRTCGYQQCRALRPPSFTPTAAAASSTVRCRSRSMPPSPTATRTSRISPTSSKGGVPRTPTGAR